MTHISLIYVEMYLFNRGDSVTSAIRTDDRPPFRFCVMCVCDFMDFVLLVCCCCGRIGNRIGVELDRSVDGEIQMGDDRWDDSSVRESNEIHQHSECFEYAWRVENVDFYSFS